MSRYVDEKGFPIDDDCERERTLSDNEIIKALEICASGTCEGCNTKHGYDCVPLDMETILSLINRQKAEIERLDYKLGCLLCHATGSKLSKSTYSLKTMEYAVNDHIEYCCEEATAEAIKEFAERLKDKSSKISLVCSGALVKTDYTIAGTDLDNLVKEMVGDNNE